MLKILITKHLTKPVQKVSQAPTQGAFFLQHVQETAHQSKTTTPLKERSSKFWSYKGLINKS